VEMHQLHRAMMPKPGLDTSYNAHGAKWGKATSTRT
jgi:hypothetical protein